MADAKDVAAWIIGAKPEQTPYFTRAELLPLAKAYVVLEKIANLGTDQGGPAGGIARAVVANSLVAEQCPITVWHDPHPWLVHGEGAGPRWCDGRRTYV